MTTHKISLALDGVVTDLASAELPDGEAFVLFVQLKTALLQGSPSKRKVRRSAPSTANGDAGDVNAPGDGDEG